MESSLNNGMPFDVTMAQSLGYTAKDLRALSIEGSIRRQFRGVYVDAKVPDSRELRLAGIRLVAPPEAIVCNESASWLFGVDTHKPSEQYVFEPSLVVPHGSTRVTKSGVRCRQAHIDQEDVTQIDDVLVTTPVRTTSDLLRRLYRPYALAAADGMAHSGLIDVQDTHDFIGKLKGYPGIVQARSLATMIDPLAASPGESWQRLRIIDAGFPIPQSQVLICDADGRERWVDHAYEEFKIAMEYDGREFHTSLADVQHDDERRSYLKTVLGWRFVIARREDIFGESTTFEEEIGRMLGIAPMPRSWGRKSLTSARNSLIA